MAAAFPVPSGQGSASADSATVLRQFGQFFLSQNLSFSFDLFHGDTSFSRWTGKSKSRRN